MQSSFDDGIDFDAFSALEVVERAINADDLTDMVIEDQFPWEGRTAAAKKLLEMWREGLVGGITIDHIACVRDHSVDPYKSEANQIIRDHF